MENLLRREFCVIVAVLLDSGNDLVNGLFRESTKGKVKEFLIPFTCTANITLPHSIHR